jgi:hypothetical protein
LPGVKVYSERNGGGRVWFVSKGAEEKEEVEEEERLLL